MSVRTKNYCLSGNHDKFSTYGRESALLHVKEVCCFAALQFFNFLKALT